MRSVVFIISTISLIAGARSSFAQTSQPPPSKAAFPSDSEPAAPAPPASAPPAPVPPPTSTPTPPPPAAVAPTPVAPPPGQPPTASPAPPGAPPPPGAFAAAMAVPPPAPRDSVSSTAKVVDPVWPPRLVQKPGVFGGVEAYGGLLAAGGADTREAYAIVGGQLRLRYDYYELGGWYDVSDRGKQQQDGFSSFGAFVGAWLPYRGWVDFELAASVGARTYTSDDVRYGDNGYEHTSPTLGLRLGVSDRTSSFSAFAGRIGGQLLFSYDLSSDDKPWEVASEQEGMTTSETGVTNVGGFTLGLALILGFDYGKAITPSPAASEAPK